MGTDEKNGRPPTVKRVRMVVVAQHTEKMLNSRPTRRVPSAASAPTLRRTTRAMPSSSKENPQWAQQSSRIGTCTERVYGPEADWTKRSYVRGPLLENGTPPMYIYNATRRITGDLGGTPMTGVTAFAYDASSVCILRIFCRSPKIG